MKKSEVAYVGTCPHGKTLFFAIEDHSDKSYSRQIEKDMVGMIRRGFKIETVSEEEARHRIGNATMCEECKALRDAKKATAPPAAPVTDDSNGLDAARKA
jgi:hypothetical protein